MEDEGYIENYQANVNKAKAGIAMSFFVEVSLNSHQEESIAAFERALSNMDEVINGHVVSFLRLFIRSGEPQSRWL
ncbi:Lrp/AsnC family transcriptional regulator [Psychrobacter sp. JCM 18900]|uniref:Lrp/AsnC family transcriptional regulator n=1 Tax=Psychrobacter sp. JCM 18900 TaxID=1298608 RepID=UPI00043482D2|nr:hypothetical protein [Psychrobacter sp. JCM 18900]GAF53683.1 transcriptional regulator, AsnC family [Psychrobacter sp. JCM 18900]